MKKQLKNTSAAKKQKKRSLAILVKELEKTRDNIGKERDHLRNILDEINALESVASEGIEALDNAIDTLSQQV